MNWTRWNIWLLPSKKIFESLETPCAWRGRITTTEIQFMEELHISGGMTVSSRIPSFSLLFSKNFHKSLLSVFELIGPITTPFFYWSELVKWLRVPLTSFSLQYFNLLWVTLSQKRFHTISPVSLCASGCERCKPANQPQGGQQTGEIWCMIATYERTFIKKTLTIWQSVLLEDIYNSNIYLTFFEKHFLLGSKLFFYLFVNSTTFLLTNFLFFSLSRSSVWLLHQQRLMSATANNKQLQSAALRWAQMS